MNVQGGILRLLQGGKTLILMKGRGEFLSNFIISRGEMNTNYGVKGDTLPL